MGLPGRRPQPAAAAADHARHPRLLRPGAARAGALPRDRARLSDDAGRLLGAAQRDHRVLLRRPDAAQAPGHGGPGRRAPGRAPDPGDSTGGAWRCASRRRSPTPPRRPDVPAADPPDPDRRPPPAIAWSRRGAASTRRPASPEPRPGPVGMAGLRGAYKGGETLALPREDVPWPTWPNRTTWRPLRRPRRRSRCCCAATPWAWPGSRSTGRTPTTRSRASCSGRCSASSTRSGTIPPSAWS